MARAAESRRAGIPTRSVGTRKGLLDKKRAARESGRGIAAEIRTRKRCEDSMNNMMEMMVFRQMFGGGESWVQAVFLAGVFLVIAFRRDQIVAPYMFRISIIFYVLSFIAPALITSMLQYTLTRRANIGMLPSEDKGAWLQLLTTGTGPLLLGLSVLLCILSMLPIQSRYPAPPERPSQPHPLD